MTQTPNNRTEKDYRKTETIGDIVYHEEHGAGRIIPMSDSTYGMETGVTFFNGSRVDCYIGIDGMNHRDLVPVEIGIDQLKAEIEEWTTDAKEWRDEFIVKLNELAEVQAREQRLKEAVENALKWTWYHSEENMTEIDTVLNDILSTLYPDTPAPTTEKNVSEDTISRKPFFTGYKPQFIGPRKETTSERSLRLDIDRMVKEHEDAVRNPKGAPAPKAEE